MCRVLVLDDNLDFGELIKLVIEERSTNTVDAVTDSREAVDLVTRSLQRGKPYEVLLIDQQLADGENGIEVMQSLRTVSPDSETIIFTGYGDAEVGMQAYRAGAFRYLPKPFENDELLYLIDAVREWRRARQEHGWQKIFSEMMETALQQHSFQEAADVVVNYSLRLGFERAHLFWVPSGPDINDQNLLVGISNAGANKIPDFHKNLFPLHEWFELEFYDQRKAVLLPRFRQRISGEDYGYSGYQLPLMEAIILPIRQADSLRGMLLLDFGQRVRTLSEHERSMLSLFAQQVAVVLNQASLHGREQKLIQESALIQRIGRQINAKAASANWIDLLEEIRRQIGDVMDVSNFSIFLHNEETDQLDFDLLYEQGVRRKGIRRDLNHGFEEYLLASQKEILLSHAGLEDFIEVQQINFEGPAPFSLLGVPLRVGERTIGGILVSQYSAQGSEYLENDKRILLSVADLVAGAIQISRLSDAEKEDTRRMQVMQKASTEMLRIAQENLDQFWLTLLTIATSNFGLGFNRALLFLGQDNFQKICGRMGVGTDNTEDARRDWERDEKRGYDFENFLEDLGTRRRRPTDFETLVQKIEFKLSDGNDAISEVIRRKNRIILEEHQVAGMLPPEITGIFSLSRCAVLPLRAGDQVMGLVIVDNKHNRELLKERSLDRLQGLLDNAGLVYETYQEKEKSASLLDANYEILAGAQDQVLQETLSGISRTAQNFTGADWVVILPLLESDARKFDLDNLGFAGTLKNPLSSVIGPAPNFGGISQYVLRRGTLVVENIREENPAYRHLKIGSHHFIKDEDVAALIGAAVRSREEDKPLGLLYLDYRKPQDFSELKIRQAVSFASLAGVAISNARRMNKLQQRMELRTAKEIAETVGTGLTLEKTLETTMQLLHRVFDQDRICVLLYHKNLDALKFAPATLKYYKVPNPEFRGQDTFPLSGKSIACRIAKEALQTGNVLCRNVGAVLNDPDYLALSLKTQSEMCVSLMSTKDELLGVLVVESQTLNGFDDVDEDLVTTVAQQLSLAIELTQQSEELEFRTTVAAQTAWAADIAHEINNEVGQIRNWAYLLQDRLKEDKELQGYAHKIEESASVLSSTGPWSDKPPQVLRLDLLLKRHLLALTSQRSLPVEFHLQAEDIYINVNPVAFQHVLRHLVRNAARAMADSKTRKIIVTTRPVNGNSVEILLQDTGPGISREVQLSIFQRPITTKGRGGYGLLLVRQMIEDMGGEISYVPQKKGAAFSIRFRVASTMGGTVE